MNRETKAASQERKTKQTRSMIKDIVICKPKPLPGPLLRYGKKSQEIKNEIKLAWTVSDTFTFHFINLFLLRVRVRTLRSGVFPYQYSAFELRDLVEIGRDLCGLMTDSCNLVVDILQILISSSICNIQSSYLQ